jgi:uncharacterized NAD-dependent epimerase/dehydratase family protein
MSRLPEGNAVVFCQGAFATTNGKTAHGLVRRTRRYRVQAVIDSRYAGQDAGLVLDSRANGIPLVANLSAALQAARDHRRPATHFVMGLAPDGGRLPRPARRVVLQALRSGLNVDSGLHDFLSEDPELAAWARRKKVRIRDIRKPPPRNRLHFFSGRIEQVRCLKVAMLGADSAIGKRTTAWVLVDALNRAGHQTELIGTGQTAWLQGARYGIILDSLINDFVAGEIEHAVVTAWREQRPEVIVIEGQGSLMNPAYPGGFEILAAGRPDLVVFQHAPARREYDGFPGYPLHSLAHQMEAIRMLSGKPVVAVAVNHEDLSARQTDAACREITCEFGLPAVDVLKDGADPILAALLPHLKR